MKSYASYASDFIGPEIKVFGDDPAEAQTYWDEVAERHGSKILESVSRIFLRHDGPTLTINLNPDLLPDIFETGRILNAYQTGKSGADTTSFTENSVYFRQRRLIENKTFGLSNTTPLDRRPIVAAVNWLRHPDGAAPLYGEACIELHREITERAIFCLGDLYHQSEAEIFSHNVLTPKIIDTFSANGLNHIFRSHHGSLLPPNPYIEAYIFAPLRVESIISLRVNQRKIHITRDHRALLL